MPWCSSWARRTRACPGWSSAAATSWSRSRWRRGTSPSTPGSRQGSCCTRWPATAPPPADRDDPALGCAAAAGSGRCVVVLLGVRFGREGEPELHRGVRGLADPGAEDGLLHRLAGEHLAHVALHGGWQPDVVPGLLGQEPPVLQNLVEDLGRLELAALVPGHRAHDGLE